MKKIMIILAGACLLLSSCGSYEASGAYTGAQFGNVLGSAIGGIAGGWRGHEIGSIVGTVGGTVAGAAIGSAVDKAQERKVQERMAARQKETARRLDAITQGNTSANGQYDYGESGYDPQMRGDDRITFDMGSSTDNSFYAATPRPVVSINNAGVYEDEHDGVLRRGESCKVIFEIRNNSDHAVNDVFPLVEEVTGNKHIHISPNLRVESIAPHQAIRYTAMLSADRGLRNGQIEVRIGVALGEKLMETQTQSFTLPTAK